MKTFILVVCILAYAAIGITGMIVKEQYKEREDERLWTDEEE